LVSALVPVPEKAQVLAQALVSEQVPG